MVNESSQSTKRLEMTRDMPAKASAKMSSAKTAVRRLPLCGDSSCAHPLSSACRSSFPADSSVSFTCSRSAGMPDKQKKARPGVGRAFLCDLCGSVQRRSQRDQCCCCFFLDLNFDISHHAGSKPNVAVSAHIGRTAVDSVMPSLGRAWLPKVKLVHMSCGEPAPIAAAS